MFHTTDELYNQIKMKCKEFKKNEHKSLDIKLTDEEIEQIINAIVYFFKTEQKNFAEKIFNDIAIVWYWCI